MLSTGDFVYAQYFINLSYSPLLPLYIVNLVYEHHFYQVVSTVQQTRVSLSTVCEENNTMTQFYSSKKFRNSILYRLAFTQKAPIQKFWSFGVSIWGQIHLHIDKNKTPSLRYGVWTGK